MSRAVWSIWPSRAKPLSLLSQPAPLKRGAKEEYAFSKKFQKNFLKKVDERMKMRYTVYC